MTMDEAKATSQRSDPKCWKGKHKEGTKVKGGVRVNNCVPNEGVEEGIVGGTQHVPAEAEIKKIIWDTLHISEPTAKESVEAAITMLSNRPKTRMVQQLMGHLKALSDRARLPLDPAIRRVLNRYNESVDEDSWYAGDGGEWGQGDAWTSDKHEMVETVSAASNPADSMSPIHGEDANSAVPTQGPGVDDAQSPIHGGMDEARLMVGDPVIVTAPNEFEGKTGEISEFSPSGKFVIVDLYNYGEHSMHLSDVEYNQHADDEDEMDEGYASTIGINPPALDAVKQWKIQVRQLVADYIKNPQGLYNLAKRKGPNSAEAIAYKYLMKPTGKIPLPPNQQGMTENSDPSPVAGAITRRILQQRLDLLKQYGPELVGAAVDNVADYVGDVDEIGSSDVSGWVSQVERMLKENPPEAFGEGWSDAIVSQRTGSPRTPYSVYIKGKKWKDFENEDHAEAVANKLRAKFKIDGRDPGTITISPTDMSEGSRSSAIQQGQQDYARGLSKQQNPYYKSDNGKTSPAAYDWEAGWDDAKDSGKIPQPSVAEDWSKKYKKSINCSHPKGFSQKAHCAGKKKHNESHEAMEMVCEDCGMCETHGDHSQQSLGEACWKGYHKEGMKTMFGKRYPNCVKNKNESLETYIKRGECPGCGGPMVNEDQLNEKQDACYHKVKSRYKVWPSAYASGALVQCRKKGAANWGNSNESITQEEYDQLDENLKKWFSDKWVRFGPDGKIKGDCARGDDSEGKPKCLPQSKAHSLGKKGRASAAARKRREDPNPERSGKAINVNTKKTSNEGQTDYQKRRQRERDIDAGKPVARQPRNPQTDYARKRAKEKRDLEQFGESTNYWTRLKNERNTTTAKLVAELQETIEDIK
jgi:hypothetical protein